MPTELPSPTSPAAMVGATDGQRGGRQRGQSGEIWSNLGGFYILYIYIYLMIVTQYHI